MKKKKRNSNKTNLSTKRLIRKKKKAFINKSKKMAKSMLVLGIRPRTRHKKQQLSVPNLCPFKKALLNKALRRRADLKLELEQKKLNKTERSSDLRKAVANCKKEREKGLRTPKSLKNTSWNGEELKLPQSKWEHKHLYFRELKQVISVSDIVIEVLDARDPAGCRSRAVELQVLGGKATNFSGNKKLILLLNKIDLIPSTVLASWMKILRREHPVIAFKASTQSKRRKSHSHISFAKATSDSQGGGGNRCVGGQALMELLKKYSLSADGSKVTPITVGLIGYPNTGKSSVINSLKRQQSVGVSSTAGFTTKLAEVRLDKMVTLVDSPGVILKDDEAETRLVLRNALKLQHIDAIATVAHILTVAKHRALAEIYDVPMESVGRRGFSSVEQWLTALAMKLGHLRSGGVANLQRAARLMVNDWNHGKIPFYVTPPEESAEEREGGEVRVVQSGVMGKEFDIMQLVEDNMEEAMKLRSGKKDRKYLQVQPDRFVVDGQEESDGEEESEEEEDVEMEVVAETREADEEISNTHAFMNN